MGPNVAMTSGGSVPATTTLAVPSSKTNRSYASSPAAYKTPPCSRLDSLPYRRMTSSCISSRRGETPGIDSLGADELRAGSFMWHPQSPVWREPVQPLLHFRYLSDSL